MGRSLVDEALLCAQHQGIATQGARRGKTGVDIARLQEVGKALSCVPEGFDVHRTIKRFMDNRRKMMEEGTSIDWSLAEALAAWCEEIPGAFGKPPTKAALAGMRRQRRKGLAKARP